MAYFHNPGLRVLSLVLVTVQCTAHVLLLRHVRTEGTPFAASSAVLFEELFKLTLCLGALGCSAGGSAAELWRQLFGGADAWRSLAVMAPPGLLYTLQKLLIFESISNLPATVFQLVNQLKLVFTAALSVMFLRKHLGVLQYAALAGLMGGVYVVQAMGSVSSLHGPGGHQDRPFHGFLAGFGAALSSAAAGVYVEAQLKGRPLSLWALNVQLSTVGLLLGAATCALDPQVQTQGLLHGYRAEVWLTICIASIGGLVVGLVMRYADNILKDLAIAISAILVVVISVAFFGVSVDQTFLVGAGLVLSACWLYSVSERTTEESEPLLESLKRFGLPVLDPTHPASEGRVKGQP